MKDLELNPEEKKIAARNAYWDLKWANKNITAEQKLSSAEKYIESLESENHQLACQLSEHQVTHYPRIRNLPKKEQAPFRKWLAGQTCPLIKGVPYDKQDAYYVWDYEQWKRSLAGEAVLWD